MRKIFLLFVAGIFLFSSCATKGKVNKVVFNKATNQEILLGKINRRGLEKKPFKEWFDKGYKLYKPDEKTITELKKHIAKNAKIVIIMGTWCSDSRREVPRFYKILDEIGFNKDSLTIYAVDRQMRTPKGEEVKYQIEKIPTIIYYHYNYEAGRIVESPKVSLEKDLLLFTKRK